jgi:hypothetical protein
MGGKFRGVLLLKRGAKLTFRFAEFFFSVALWLISAGLWLLWAAYVSLRMLWKAGRMLYRLATSALRGSGFTALSQAMARLRLKAITKSSKIPANAVAEPIATSG